MALFGRNKTPMVTAEEALPGRSTPMPLTERHAVTGHRIVPPFPDGLRTAVFGMGCFWGAERIFWRTPGVYSTAVEQAAEAETSRSTYQQALTAAGRGQITTEIAALRDFYYAEDYHQQYLSDAKNPNGYCGIGGTGVTCPVGVSSSSANLNPE